MAEPASVPAKAAANGFLRCPHCKRTLPARVHHEAADHVARTLTNLALVAHIVALDVRCPGCGADVDVRMGDLLPAS